jgi:hypothetical protein
VTGGERDDLFTARIKEDVGGDDQRAGATLN